ncbi:MAG: hypothetical protein ACRD3Q_15380 [Terriglobales bacterium]
MTTPAAAAETVTVENTGELAGPDLPVDVLPDGEKWHPQTEALWAELRRSPLMQGEPGLTWAYMIDTMALHHQWWAHGEHRHAAELRLRLAKIGVTPEATYPGHPACPRSGHAPRRLRYRCQASPPYWRPTELKSSRMASASASVAHTWAAATVARCSSPVSSTSALRQVVPGIIGVLVVAHASHSSSACRSGGWC